VFSQVLFEKLAVTLANFAADFALERLDGDLVSVRVGEGSGSSTPGLIFWFRKEFGSFVFEIQIGFVNVVNEQTDF
jgi:hypothetical protein